MGNVCSMITSKENARVRMIASEIYRTYCPAGGGSQVSREDLCHYGIVGLLEAKSRYDRRLKIPFLVFADRRIRGAMIDHLRKTPIVKLPQVRNQKIKIMKEVKEEIDNRGERATPEFIAEQAGWTLDEVYEVMNAPLSFVSTDNAVEGGVARTPGVILTDESQDPELFTLRSELVDLINECLENLPSNEHRLILAGRLLENLKLRELGEALGCTAENIRQRQKQSENLMKKCFERHGWPDDGLSEIF